MLNPKRTVAELKRASRIHGRRKRRAARRVHADLGEGARMVAQETGSIARLEIHNDAAGNFWATLRGESDKALLIGGHIDSVPNGGWLDGCLNTLAGVEILRRIMRNITASRRSPCGWSIGPMKKARVSGKVCSVRPPVREISTWTKRGLKGQRRNPLAGCAEGTRNRFRESEGFRQGIEKRRGLYRAAHRARPGAARSRSAAWARCSARSASSGMRSRFTARRRIPAARR